MSRKSLAKGTIKISSIIFILFSLGFFVFNYVLPVFALHTSTTSLEPEWSPAGQNVDYNVEIDNTDGDTIYEIRIYKNSQYSNFECDDKPGWEKLFISSLQACFYVTTDPDIAIEEGESTSFGFSATTPASSPENCNLEWKFETRDDSSYWQFIIDNTSVDDLPPVISKTVGNPKYESNGDLFITQSTPIILSAEDEGACEPPSGIDYCQYRYFVDDVLVLDWTGWDPDGFTFSFPEDSTHVLEVKCVDEAGNEATLTETDIVETVPPETTKELVGPKKIIETEDGNVEWSDGVTEVVLNPTDPEPHPSGVDKTWYRNTIDQSEESCWYPQQNCNPNEFSYPKDCIDKVQVWCGQNWDNPQNEVPFDSWEACVEYLANDECDFEGWKLYTGPFQKEEESCHVLEFFSIDNLGNRKNSKANCFFVDKTPPVLTKDVGKPSVDETNNEELGNGDVRWTTAQSSSGQSSAKLIIPDNPSSGDFAGVDSFFDVFVELDDITSLTYDRMVVQFDNGWSPIVVLGIDADGDGVFEAKPLEWEASLGLGAVDPTLLGDDSFVQCEAEIPIEIIELSLTSVNAYDTFKCYTPNVAGDGYEGVYDFLNYFQNNNVGRVEATDKVAMVKVELGGNPATQDNEIAYVDSVKLNDVVIIDEPGFTRLSPVTDITFTCIDPRPHPSDDEEVCFKVSFDKEPYDLTSLYATKYQTTVGLDGFACVPVNGNNQFVFNFNEEEDSLHDLEYYCKDAVEKKSETEIQWYKVDSVPPVITKEIIGPQSGDCPPEEGQNCYIQDSETIIRVNAEDNAGAHDSGVNRCEWSYTLDGQPVGEPVRETSFPFNIIFPEDSTHVLTIDCFDKLGNNRTDVETFEVDSIPPVTKKTYGEPYVQDYFPNGCNYDNNDCNGEGCYDNGYECGWAEWINSSTPITLTATDNKVGVDKTYWRNTLLESDVPCYSDELCQQLEGSEDFSEYTSPFTKPEESCHLIEYYSVDLLGNEEKVEKQCVFVDNTEPTARADTGNPKIRCPEDDTTGCDYWIRDQVTEISLSCSQVGKHPSPLDKIQWRWNVDGGDWKGWFEAPASEGAIVVFEEESVHTLEYTCNDTLGNQDDVKTKIYKVDSSPPIITKEIIGPQLECTDYEGQLDCIQIDGVTKINVDAVDPEPHPVNDVTCDWSYEVIDNDASGGEEKVTPPFVIQFPEESIHDLIITCRDALGNKASDEEIFIVDKTPPETNKIYEGPFYENENAEWISTETDVVLSANDNAGPHDSGVKTTYWRNTVVDDTYCDGRNIIDDDDETNDDLLYCDDAVGSGEWNLYTDPFNKEEQSCHLIEYYSVDNVEKTEEVKKQCVFVDNTPPITTKEIIGPQYEKDGKLYIDGVTNITLTCEDSVPHPSGVANIQYRYNVDDEEWTDWFVYKGSFSFPEESKHTLEYYCSDNLGNKEATQTEIDYVDKTPPETTKWYEGFSNRTNDIEWINTDTLIHLDASDGEEVHASGVKETLYRNTLVDSRFCLSQGACYDAEGSGNFIKYVDSFNKPEESCHLIEYYSVDNVDKTEEVNRQCVFVDDSLPVPNKTVGEPKAECSEGDWCDWKITTLTPVKLDCSDTHIVGEQEVCHRIILDGELQNGELEDGWTCGEAPKTIYFPEESNHTLEFYCEDALQKSSVDSENFKVEGTAFTIHLNKKWNLISVPFVMLNNSMDEAFKDVGTDISSVWTYDAETDQWYVYTPANGPDTLTEMKPGWGYWVLAKNDTLLVIGGSLFSPATTPPSRDLLEGWNLIGYYGTEDMLAYDGPDGNGDSADCALNSLGSSIWDKEFTSLWTYWESSNPNQWIPYNKWNNMDPGAGYWVSIPEDGLYTPSTTCGISF